MPRPSSRDPFAGPRARPSGPGPDRHLIPWTPPPAQATAQIPRSGSESPTGLARRPRRPGLAEPRPRTASGPGQQRRRRAGRGAEGRGAGLGLTLTALLWATRDPAPPPRPAIPLTRQPPALLPPRGGTTAAFGPPPTAAPPSSSSSSPKGGRAAAAQAGAEPPRRSPGRPRPPHSPAGGASRGEGPRRAGPRSRVRAAPPLSLADS
ncbi:proline-rich proteoglycan 2-like [Apodemus sylvaticus]|uniref:proline-rich proteoglycan 2-like n=1 Tax=Apodemus sylvaticus TaxID=10129 RepID=UPI002243CE8D|nr:proline-rich proteoglycan 2-like [Apodemus sylvaticus]